MKFTLLSPLPEAAGHTIADLLTKNQQLVIKIILVTGIAFIVAQNVRRILWCLNFSVMLLIKSLYRVFEYHIAWVFKLNN